MKSFKEYVFSYIDRIGVGDIQTKAPPKMIKPKKKKEDQKESNK